MTPDEQINNFSTIWKYNKGMCLKTPLRIMVSWYPLNSYKRLLNLTKAIKLAISIVIMILYVKFSV